MVTTNQVSCSQPHNPKLVHLFASPQTLHIKSASQSAQLPPTVMRCIQSPATNRRSWRLWKARLTRCAPSRRHRPSMGGEGGGATQQGTTACSWQARQSQHAHDGCCSSGRSKVMGVYSCGCMVCGSGNLGLGEQSLGCVHTVPNALHLL